jgi:hypothetical protein
MKFIKVFNYMVYNLQKSKNSIFEPIVILPGCIFFNLIGFMIFLGAVKVDIGMQYFPIHNKIGYATILLVSLLLNWALVYKNDKELQIFKEISENKENLKTYFFWARFYLFFSIFFFFFSLILLIILQKPGGVWRFQ